MLLIDHEYHIVELYHVPDEVFSWLEEIHGPGDGTVWMYKHPKIYFANPKDHMMFLLRWS